MMSPINCVFYLVGDEYTPHGPKTINEKFIRYLVTSQHLRLQGSEVSETVVVIVEDYRIFFMSHVYIVTT